MTAKRPIRLISISTLSPSCIAPRPWWLVPMKSTSPGSTGVIAVAQAIDSAIECAASLML